MEETKNRVASTKRKAITLHEHSATTPEPSRENEKEVGRESRENEKDVGRERRENEKEVGREGRDKDKEVERQMERFYALLENIKAMRHTWVGVSSDGGCTKTKTGERKEAEVPWKPTFRLEDFMQGEDDKSVVKRVKKDDGEVVRSNGS